ncbi:MAG TPA: YetF domain-containing protein, partial [Gaiellales bacterium]|nr:YetF domain-containing protein [Gaiellales bacterium]
VILVEHGRPLHNNLRRERITLRELAAQARQRNIRNLADVDYAVLETSGVISFLTSATTD